MQPSSRSPRCLEAHPLVLAADENHRSWFCVCANASQGHAHHHDSVLWTHPGDRDGDGHVAFPDLAASFPDDVLDALISDYRHTKPAVNVLCWATAPDRELGVRLVARGFEKSWRPHWMAADLTLVDTNVVAPELVTFELAEHLPESAWPQPPRAPHPGSSLSQPDDRRSWHFAAVLAGRVVGQSKLHLTSGVRGVAGVYDVEVDRAFQRRGIGRALTAMALEEARRRGYRHAVLNSTPAGEQLYRRLGFQSLGHGQTWSLRAEVLLAPPAEVAQVPSLRRLAEVTTRRWHSCVGNSRRLC